MTVQTIRRVLRGEIKATTSAVEARERIRRELSLPENFDWSGLAARSFNTGAPAIHGNVQYKACFNALPTKANLVKWTGRGNGRTETCPNCPAVDTVAHVFTCPALKPLHKLLLNTVRRLGMQNCTVPGFLFGSKTRAARSLACESLHQIWRSRCMSVFEGKPPNCEAMFNTISNQLKRATPSLWEEIFEGDIT